MSHLDELFALLRRVLPSGGAVATVLTKNSAADYDVKWTASGVPSINSPAVLANVSGSAATPVGTTVSALLDAALGATQGQLITRNAGGWTVLNPGTSGQLLQANGPGANLSWFTPLPVVNFSVTCSAAGALAAGDTKAAFNTVGYDSAGAFNTSTNTYVIPVAGKWRFDLRIFAGGGGGALVQGAAIIYKNGARAALGSYAAATTQKETSSVVPVELVLAVGDSIAAYFYAFGGATTLQPGPELTMWTGRLVG